MCALAWTIIMITMIKPLLVGRFEQCQKPKVCTNKSIQDCSVQIWVARGTGVAPRSKFINAHCNLCTDNYK